MKKMIFLGCAAIFASLANECDAGFVLTLDDGAGNSVIVEDGGANDSNLAVGEITFIGSLGGTTVWTTNITTGLSKPTLGPKPEQDLNSVNVSSSEGGTLYLTLTDTDYDLGVTGSNLGVVMGIGGTTRGTVTAQYWADDTNGDAGEFGMSQDLGTLGPFNTFAFSGMLSTTSLSTIDGIVSLTQQITIVHTSGGSTSFDSNLMVAPEPTSMAIMGLGTLLAGFGVRRRKRKMAELVA